MLNFIEGVHWKKVGEPRKIGKRYVYPAVCLVCGANFASHRSIFRHAQCCQGPPTQSDQGSLDAFINQNIDTSEELTDSDILLINAIASLDLPIRSVENEELRKLLQVDAMPSSYEIRQKIISYSERLKKKTLTELRGKRVALVLDGTTTWHEKLYEFVLYYPGELHHYGLIEIAQATAANIAKVIETISKDLTNNGITLVGCTTDNAPNLVAAFNGVREYSIQNRLKLPMIRFACGCHTGQLVFEDLRKQSEAFEELEDEVEDVIAWCRKNKKELRERGMEGKVPSICPTRWNTYGDAFQYFVEHIDFFVCAMDEMANTEPPYIEDTIWQAAIDVMHPIMNFTRKVEGNLVPIATLFKELLEMENSLKSISRDNPFVSIVSSSVRERFMVTCDGKMAELAFLLTEEGMIWWKEGHAHLPPGNKIYLTAEDELNIASYAIEKNIVAEKLKSFAQTMQLDGLAAENVFRHYLEMDPQIMHGDPLGFWTDSLGQYITCNGVEIKMQPLAQCALILLVLPASEAVVERVFSVLKGIHTDQRASLKPDILDALLRIKLELIWSEDATK